MTAGPLPPAGYYPAPGDQGYRYWDGQQWTSDHRPAMRPPSPPATPSSPSTSEGLSLSSFNWRALVSLRVFFFALLMLALAAALWPPLGVVAFVGVYVLAFLNTGAVYACPSCRKRVKVGATHCHHCGQAVA